MNDGMYTNLRNYLEEIAQNTKRILDLLEAQKAPAKTAEETQKAPTKKAATTKKGK
jgi:hypothetical protein